MKHKVVISINSAWNIFNFRAGLIKALVEHGYEVIAVAPYDDYVPRLQALGCTYVELPMDCNGTNPLRDMMLFYRYVKVLRTIRPVAFLSYTIKPNIYGSLAAQALGIPVINNIAGLGATFIRNNYLTRIVRGLYKLAMKRSCRIFFQNADDRKLFLESGLAREEVSGLVPGSGVNLTRYSAQPAPSLEQRRFRFLFVGRMLRDKGVEELAEALRLLRQQGHDVECQLLGFVDPANANAVSMEKIRGWEKDGILSYLGKTDDVRPYIGLADCVVLPSYREGVPRSLLEAAAMARPIIATDVVGCRDAVDHGINGYLCQVKDPVDLASKMAQMVALAPQQRTAMGTAGRYKVEVEFDEQIVIKRYLGALHEILPVNVSSEGASSLIQE